MELPRGIDISVPDLSRFGKKDPIAIKVNPGDRVMVLLPRNSSQQEVAGITEHLVNWAPDTQFIVLAGPESITVIPAPVADTEPQGLMTDEELVAYARKKATEESSKQSALAKVLTRQVEENMLERDE